MSFLGGIFGTSSTAGGDGGSTKTSSQTRLEYVMAADEHVAEDREWQVQMNTYIDYAAIALAGVLIIKMFKSEEPQT